MTGDAARFHVPMVGCPIEACLGSLGKKWTLLLLRDLAYFDRHTFGEFLNANDGLTPRVLSRRLVDMANDGLLARRAGVTGRARYELTTKGRDALPVLAALFQFGAKHNALQSFADGQAHSLREVFRKQPQYQL